MTLEDKTLKRIERLSKYRPVSEKEYLSAIKKALRDVQIVLSDMDTPLYKRSRAEELARAFKREIDKSTTGFITGFFNDLLDVVMGDTKKLNADGAGYIDGFYKLDEKEVKSIIGFKEIYFTTEKADGSISHSLISVDKLLKSVGKDAVKRVNDALISGAVQGVNPNKIASQIGKIKGIEARHLRTTVRTIIGDAQQRVNDESLKLNKDFYDGFAYVAKLDKRTTPICKSLDDKRWDKYDDIPKDNKPPLHVNCRSTIIGII